MDEKRKPLIETEILKNFGNYLNLIKYPLVTEKTMSGATTRQHTFLVARSLTKTKIKFLLEKVLNVKISDLNTLILPIKKRRVGRFVGKKTNYKKVYLTLKEGFKIEEFSQ